MNEIPFQSDLPEDSANAVTPNVNTSANVNDEIVARQFEIPCEVENVEGFYELHPDVIRADQIAGLIFFGVVTVGMVIGLFFKVFDGIDGVFYGLAAAAVAVALGLLWLGIFWPRIEYRRTRWRLDNVGLEIHKGVLWRHRKVVPLARVQHADVGQGPIQRMYELGTLTVHTAGTQHSSVELSGLHHQVALHLRDRLVRQKHQHQEAPSNGQEPQPTESQVASKVLDQDDLKEDPQEFFTFDTPDSSEKSDHE